MSEPKVPYIECSKGWASLYEPLIWYCAAKGIPVMQVKEKFGTLRFYTGPNEDPHIDTLVAAVEAYSGHVCEECSERGVVTWERQEDGSYKTIFKATTGPSRTSSWIKTLCAPCREARDKQREKRNLGG